MLPSAAEQQDVEHVRPVQRVANYRRQRFPEQFGPKDPVKLRGLMQVLAQVPGRQQARGLGLDLHRQRQGQDSSLVFV
jgi:hypothetical protein